MSIWTIILSVIAGAAVTEVYHARMWARYQQGKREGMRIRTDLQQAKSSSLTIRR